MVFYHFFNQPQVWGPVKMFPKVFREKSNFIHSAKRKKVIPSFPNLNPTSTLGKFGYHTSRRLFCTERGKHLISYLIKHTLIFRCMLNGKFLRANCHPPQWRAFREKTSSDVFRNKAPYMSSNGFSGPATY